MSKVEIEPPTFGGKSHGAQGRDRTTDTAIFSRMLYQLSYLGTARRRARERRFIVRPESRVHPALPSITPGAAPLRSASQIFGKSRLFGVFIGFRLAGYHVGAGQPAVEVDVAAAFGTERLGVLDRRFPADRAFSGACLAGSAVFGRLSRHSTSRIESE